ncbi:MAG TPA: S8 family serine peptidase [Thermoanaerobaculia bacterium]
MFDTGGPSQPLVITVGGTTQSDQRYQLGANDGSNFGECVSIYAPAHVIHAAHIAAPNAYRDDSSYVVDPWDVNTMEFYASGTSFAAPVVAGVAARLLQKYPYYTVRQIWEEIYSRAYAVTVPADFDGDGIERNNRVANINMTD